MIIFARFRTYCHATEDEARVRQALMFISGIQDKAIEVTVNKGYHGNEIRVLEAELKKGPALTKFLESLAEAKVFEKVKDEISVRIDDEGMFYLRFDKQEAFNGKIVLDSGSDTIQASIRVQAYPSKPEKVLEEFKAQIEKLEKKVKKRAE
jgi:RNA binding exosome subunit